MTDPVLPCHVCHTGELLEFPEYPTLGRVTSDVKPWPAGGRLAVCRVCGIVQKVIDARWEAEAAEVYRAYSLYHNASGTEQHVFADGGQAMTRSARLVEGVRDRVGLPARGRLLDVGCGNGGLLRSFARLNPGWTLAGTELDGKTRAAVEAIPGVEQLYTCEVDEVPGEFDVVTLVHVLEHVPDPVALLRRLARKVRPGGLVVVDVPDYTRSPFDLAVTDHCTHFDPDTLAAVFRAAGLELAAVGGDFVPKEVTAAGRPGGAVVPLGTGAPDRDATAGTVRAHLRWLADLVDGGRRAAEGGRFGVFGTSIAAAWLLGQLGHRVEFFVDEDRAKVGQTWEGRPILAPGDVPPGSAVYLGLIPAVAAGIGARLAPSGRVRVHLPPALHAA